MSPHRVLRIVLAPAVALALVAAFTVAVAAPAQADDRLIRVSKWCGSYITFTNLTGKKVYVSYRSGVPVSPFPAQEGEFFLKRYSSYTLKVKGSKHYGDEGTTHRLYYEAEQGDDDQDGYVRQWRYCGGLVKWSTYKCYVKFTNISPYRIWISYRDGDDYYYWDDDFRLFPGRSKTLEFHARVLKFIAERKSDAGYKRQFGTVYLPKKCKYYKDDDDDDDDDEFDPDFLGELILRLIPGAPEPSQNVGAAAPTVGEATENAN